MDEAITDTGSMDSQIVELPTFADLTSLSSEKLQQLVSTLAFILTLPAARETYAQLIDGRRTWPSYVKNRGSCDEATIISDHPTPSDEAIQLYEEIRATLTMQTLKVGINAYLPYPTFEQILTRT